MSHPRMFAAVAAFTALAALAAGCGDDSSPVETGESPTSSTTSTTSSTTTTTTSVAPVDPDSPEGRLAAARALWTETGPESYRLSTRELCFCPETIWTDTVVAGEVVSHEPGSEDTFYDPGERTMLSLYDEVAAAIDAGYFTLELELDPDTGALISYWVDVDDMTADEEYGVEVVSLEALDD